MNEVILIGRVGNKPEITETKNGTKVATISIPLFHSYAMDNKETEWVRCEALGKLANIVEMAEKGVMVSVRGELNNQRWKDEEGKWKYRTWVKIDSFRFLEKKKSAETTKTEETPIEEKRKNDNENKHPKGDADEVETPSADDIDNFLENL